MHVHWRLMLCNNKHLETESWLFLSWFNSNLTDILTFMSLKSHLDKKQPYKMLDFPKILWTQWFKRLKFTLIFYSAFNWFSGPQSLCQSDKPWPFLFAENS